MTIHLTTLMVIGMLMLPASVVVFFLLGLLGGWLDLELGILPFAGIPAMLTFATGCALILVGIGQVSG